MTANLRAWAGEFHDVPWTEVEQQLRVMSLRHSDFQYLSDIVDSILLSGHDHRLAGQTSMHDLVVTTRPILKPPYEEVVVRAPGSLEPPPAGSVMIDCLSDTGHSDRIIAPVGEAVPLFWRCVAAVFDISPTAHRE
ncbi:hypothetical protein ACFVUS_28895 [Nocardia sp. NPDC058058]|uniref:hypothetical protein n=1 Tax=Nocardia sp. NPDC058058 TaxID=3346317 RepID=UPI0036DAD6E9